MYVLETFLCDAMFCHTDESKSILTVTNVIVVQI